MTEALHKLILFIDHHDWLVTLFVGLTAYVLYRVGRSDVKKDAAKLILQEIRYADQKVKNYRTYNSYNFAEKILPTNNWNKNINLFIRDLTESQLDLISKFFSSAEYLDDIIELIANSRNNQLIKNDTPLDNSLPKDVAMGTGNLDSNEGAKKLIEAISKDIESIYNTPAADKLRKIAEKKWYQPRWLIL